MQILLIQDRLELREKMVFLIESTYQTRVFECSNFLEALNILATTKPPIEFIMVDTKEGSPESIEAFWKTSAPTPILVCAQSVPAAIPSHVIGIVERSVLSQSVVKAIQELINKGTLKQVSAETSDQDMVRIKSKLLLSVCPLKGDIYIRLSQNKFVKLFREGDVFDLMDLEKYTVRKGVEYLYIRKEQCSEFAQKYQAELEKLLQSENLSVEEASKLGESVHETVQELTRQVGFTKEVQEMTKTQVNLTVKAMGKDPDLSVLLQRLKSTEGKYISSHSTMCAYLACAIAGQLQWGSDTTFNKLSLASFLHDITLENHDLAALQTLEELEKKKSQFSAAEQKDFKDHPTVAAEMVKKMSEVPPDVDTIIRQHHERPDGTGFPRGIGHAYIAPLASVFIVAHDLTRYAMDTREKFDIQEFLNQVRDKYKSSQFKKVLSCLESLPGLKAPT